MAHATRHGVNVAEIEQILAGDPVFRPDRHGTGDFLAEGVTDGGRRLRVVVAYHSTRRVLRPIAAWEMRCKQTEPTTEAQRAEDHFADRDEEDRWGDPVDAQGPDQLSVMVSARFSRAEADQLSVAAKAAGMSRSAFVRQAALSATTGKVPNLARIRRDMDEAERRLTAARQALG